MNADELAIVGIAILIACLLLAAYIYSLRYIFQYEVGPEVLQVKLCGVIPLRRVRFLPSTGQAMYRKSRLCSFVSAQEFPGVLC